VLAKYILATLAAVFLAAAAVRMTGGRAWSHPQVRTFLLIGAIFSVVSAWLFYQQ
jgi:high-affinity Fe2+/Pb2+ permease